MIDSFEKCKRANSISLALLAWQFNVCGRVTCSSVNVAVLFQEYANGTARQTHKATGQSRHCDDVIDDVGYAADTAQLYKGS